MNTKIHTYHIKNSINEMDNSWFNLNKFVTFEKYAKQLINLVFTSIFNLLIQIIQEFLQSIHLEYCFETVDRYYFIISQARCDFIVKLDELKKSDNYWQLGIILQEMTYRHPAFIDYNPKLTFYYILNCQLELPMQIEVDYQLKDLIKNYCKKNQQKELDIRWGFLRFKIMNIQKMLIGNQFRIDNCNQQNC
ncbi:unnamed protein product [Paramecium primaurelia]|uniref:Uncharacterized protein n=1 Tax=Paramecium primaurelia TaxID=5886 RepID=A0A8S1M6Z3_PARPR|nr:unnamed protein product [Paramecium primaurelia]